MLALQKIQATELGRLWKLFLLPPRTLLFRRPRDGLISREKTDLRSVPEVSEQNCWHGVMHVLRKPRWPARGANADQRTRKNGQPGRSLFAIGCVVSMAGARGSRVGSTECAHGERVAATPISRDFKTFRSTKRGSGLRERPTSTSGFRFDNQSGVHLIPGRRTVGASSCAHHCQPGQAGPDNRFEEGLR